jgi:catechol 2,3-dioxygenase-like lactoylglutathione lyase family enzyme
MGEGARYHLRIRRFVATDLEICMAVLRLQHTSVPMPPGQEAVARRFYGEILEMVEKVPPASIVDQGLIWYFAGDDEIHLFRDDDPPGNPRQHFCLQVDDIDRLRARLVDFGVTVEDTVAVPNRPRFFVEDPFGNRIEITEVRGDYA